MSRTDEGDVCAQGTSNVLKVVLDIFSELHSVKPHACLSSAYECHPEIPEAGEAGGLLWDTDRS